MDSRAVFSPQNSHNAYEGNLPVTVGKPTQCSSTHVVTNSQASSVNRSIVGPAKSYITRTSAKALNLSKSAAQVMGVLGDQTAPTDHALDKADKFLGALKAAKNQIDTLERYIEIKFEQPAICFLPEKTQLMQEVLATFVQNDTINRRQVLGQWVVEVESLLTRHNHRVTPFVPTPVEILANCQHDGQAEAQQGEPSNKTAPTAPYQGMTEQGNNFQTQTRSAAKAASEAGMTSSTHLENLEHNKSKEEIKRYQAEIERLQNKNKILELKRDQHFLKTVQQQHDQVTADYIKAQNAKSHSKPNLEVPPARTALNDENQMANAKGFELLSQAILQLTNANTQAAADTRQMMADNQKMMSDMPRLLIEQLEALNNDGGSCKSSRISTVSRASRAQSSKSKKSVIDGVPTKGEDNNQYNPQPPPQEQQPPQSPHFTTIPIVPAQSHHGSTLKIDTLLKILPSYNGTGNLDMFISQFRAAILDNFEFTDQQKYLFLASKITGEAKRYLIESENFEKAIETTLDGLKGSFGKEETQQSLLDKLYTLPLRQTDVKSMRLDIASYDQVVHRLSDKGLSESDDRLYNPLIAKLPPRYREHMTMFLARQGEIAYYREVRGEIEVILNSAAREKTLQRFQVQTPANEIPQREALIHVAQATSTAPKPATRKGLAPITKPLAYNPHDHPVEYRDPITNTTLPGYYAPGTGGPSLTMLPRSFPYENEEPNTCKVCNGTHSDVRCPLSSTEFRDMLTRKFLCPICAQKHAIETCRASFKCGYCNGTHHMGSCPQKEHYRNKANYPAGAKKIYKFFRAPTKH